MVRVRDGEGHLQVLVDRPCITPGTVFPDDVVHIHLTVFVVDDEEA